MSGTTPQEHHLVVPRTARWYSLGAPGAPERWIACHGYGQLAVKFLRAFAPLDDGTRRIVAPEALSRFYLDAAAGRAAEPRIGASWMTREDREHEIADQGSWLDALHQALDREDRGATGRLVVLGFSQGVSTVCRWLARGRVRADRVILWAGSLPPELDLGDAALFLRHVEVALVAGDADTIVPAAVVEAQAAALRAAGIACTLHRFAGGHAIDAGTLRALAP